jgi:ADP-ribose pyrophosphatase YjhB (NUDIX family)
MSDSSSNASQDASDPPWVQWAQQLQALAQTGLTYAEDAYDTERYEQIRAIATEMMAARSQGLDAEYLVTLFAREEGYATPKVDVRGVVFRDEKLLLVKERSDGRWTLPGGWADAGESPRESVEREVCEEAGLDVQAQKLLAVYDRAKHPHTPAFPFHVYKLFIRCHVTGGTPEAGHETSDVGFFAEDDWPPLSHSRVLPDQLRHLFAHARHPDWPADFD